MGIPAKEIGIEIRKSKGIVSVAANNLGVTRNALHRRIQRSKRLQKVKWEARETIVDIAEGKLFKALTNDDWRAIKFTLATLGKDRGYVERLETEEKGETKKQIFKFGDQIIQF